MNATPLPELVAGVTADTIAQLAAAGVNAWESLQDVDPPGVLIRSPALAFRFGGCSRLTLTAWIIGPDLPRSNAMPILTATLQAAGDALGWPFPAAIPVDVAGATGGIYPAYEISWTITER